MKNPIGDDGLATLMSAIEGTGVKTISGMTEGETSLDWSNQGLKYFDMKILAADISMSPFTAGIIEVNLSTNKCFGSRGQFHDIDKDQAGWTAFCEAIKDKNSIQTLVLADIGIGPVGLTTFSKTISDVAGLLHIDLSTNKCFGSKEEGPRWGRKLVHDTDEDKTGWVTFCEAIKDNKSIQKLVLTDIGMGPMGLSTLANAIPFIAGMTKMP